MVKSKTVPHSLVYVLIKYSIKATGFCFGSLKEQAYPESNRLDVQFKRIYTRIFNVYRNIRFVYMLGGFLGSWVFVLPGTKKADLLGRLAVNHTFTLFNFNVRHVITFERIRAESTTPFKFNTDFTFSL